MTATAEPRLQTTSTYVNFGPWSAELRGDELVHIRHRGLPVLRGMRAVVRNHNWLTLQPSIMACQAHESAESLRLVLDVAWKGYAARYAGRVTVLFTADSVGMSFQGAAVEEFSSNRIGLVVLHRPDDAGQPVTVTSPSGSSITTEFPARISPHQPFRDIAALDWERNQVAYRLEFEGDVFETEDQRNWTDASFKTYSTPLSKPFPVTHRTGDTVRQGIRLSARQITRVLDEVRGAVPELGTSMGSAPEEDLDFPAPLPAGTAPLLAEIGTATDPALGLIAAADAAALARRLNLALDARIVAGTPEQAAAVVRALPLDRVSRLAVYSGTSHVTEHGLWDAVVAEARELGYRGPLVAGARSHFTELNRNRGSARPDADGTTFSITAQMHATEAGAIIETLAMQALTAADALDIGNGRPLHIGPVTLAPRFNAVATRPPLPEELPARDALEGTPFEAAWLLGSVSALTGPGTASISYGMHSGLNSPAGRLLLQLAAHRGREILATDTAPETFAVYPVRTPGGVLAFAGNLTDKEVAVRIIGPSGDSVDLSLGPFHTTTAHLS